MERKESEETKEKTLHRILDMSFDDLGQTHKTLQGRERGEKKGSERKGKTPLHLEKTLTGSHPSVAKQLGARQSGPCQHECV